MTTLYIGSDSTPIVFAEIIPIVLAPIETDRDRSEDVAETPEHRHQALFPLTNFGAKQFLLRQCRRADDIKLSPFVSNPANSCQLFIRWNTNDVDNDLATLSTGHIFQNGNDETKDLSGSSGSSDDQGKFPVMYIPSDNPTIVDYQPCCIIAYAFRDDLGARSRRTLCNIPTNSSLCHISQDTLIRILPPRLATTSLEPHLFESVSQLTAPTHLRREIMLNSLLGEVGDNNIADEMIEEVLHNHNHETVLELKAKLTAATVSIRLGTTDNALRLRDEQEKQWRKMEQSIRLFSMSNSNQETAPPKERRTIPLLPAWPSLIVHSPNHADGKTLLVQSLAKRLGCSSIHLIRPGAHLAKYSTRADSALESQLHSILVSAACRNQKVCIILDHLDTMLPAALSGRADSGDAAAPILYAISSYLRTVTDSMQRKKEFPFPIKNPLYNPRSCNDNAGQVFTVEMCLVGILTCPDDGWTSHRRNNGGIVGGGSIFDCMVCDRYRIPVLTANTILSAFEAAFAREDVVLEASAKKRLALIVSSTPWAKGSVFSRVAKQLKCILEDSSIDESEAVVGKSEATIQDLDKAIALVNPTVIESEEIENSIETESKTEIETKTSLEQKEKQSEMHFRSVGGNEHAKMALEDALALDPIKRSLLYKFGLSPPTGVLLYGPPGCGKTLLAKAVAKLLKSSIKGAAESLTQGGTFISLSISEIVSSEVGTSEKAVASSFEFAEKNAPSVIFLDEFQALFTDRNRGGSGKLTTTLLQCLDDIKRSYDLDEAIEDNQATTSRDEKRVVVIAATNTPWMIDPAFLRPGRFDRVVHVGLPSCSERQSILEVHIGRMRVRNGGNANNISKLCEELSLLTEGFSGADIAALCRATAIRALSEGGEEISVEAYHFRDALNLDMVPSSDDALVQRIRAWRP